MTLEFVSSPTLCPVEHLTTKRGKEREIFYPTTNKKGVEKPDINSRTLQSVNYHAIFMKIGYENITVISLFALPTERKLLFTCGKDDKKRTPKLMT